MVNGLRRVANLLRRWVKAQVLARTINRWADNVVQRYENNGRSSMVVLECFTTLAAIAAATHKIRLGALVAATPYRNPALLAKMNITLDVISHGRCIVGLGAGWYEEEFKAYGWHFPSFKQRIAGLEEAVQIIDRMMTYPRVTFTGKQYWVSQAISNPMPIQQPRPPILIGGSGEKHTLRVVAQYADYCNLFGDPATVERKLRILRHYCAEIGRSHESIICSNFLGILIAENKAELSRKRKQYYPWLGYPVIGTPEEVITTLRAFVDVGVQYIILNFPDAHTLRPMQLFAEAVIPAFAVE